jgi:MFS family permease
VPYTALMPVMATEVLHGGPDLYGVLMTASGVGSLLGALYLASRHSVVGLGRVIVVSTLTFGLGLGVFALSRVVWLSIAVLPLVGAGFMVQIAATNTIVQTIVEEKFRGRVMAYYTMAFLGASPLGSLAAGLMAERAGAPVTILIGGVVCLAAGLAFWLELPKLRKLMRPIYEAHGMIAVPAADAVTPIQ